MDEIRSMEKLNQRSLVKMMSKNLESQLCKCILDERKKLSMFYDIFNRVITKSYLCILLYKIFLL